MVWTVRWNPPILMMVQLRPTMATKLFSTDKRICAEIPPVFFSTVEIRGSAEQRQKYFDIHRRLGPLLTGRIVRGHYTESMPVPASVAPGVSKRVSSSTPKKSTQKSAAKIDTDQKALPKSEDAAD